MQGWGKYYNYFIQLIFRTLTEIPVVLLKFICYFLLTKVCTQLGPRTEDGSKSLMDPLFPLSSRMPTRFLLRQISQMARDKNAFGKSPPPNQDGHQHVQCWIFSASSRTFCEIQETKIRAQFMPEILFEKDTCMNCHFRHFYSTFAWGVQAQTRAWTGARIFCYRIATREEEQHWTKGTYRLAL